eukprot:365809-Chlamydomonas_euryale.AAC.6
MAADAPPTLLGRGAGKLPCSLTSQPLSGCSAGCQSEPSAWLGPSQEDAVLQKLLAAISPSVWLSFFWQVALLQMQRTAADICHNDYCCGSTALPDCRNLSLSMPGPVG